MNRVAGRSGNSPRSASRLASAAACGNIASTASVSSGSTSAAMLSARACSALAPSSSRARVLDDRLAGLGQGGRLGRAVEQRRRRASPPSPATDWLIADWTRPSLPRGGGKAAGFGDGDQHAHLVEGQGIDHAHHLSADGIAHNFANCADGSQSPCSAAYRFQGDCPMTAHSRRPEASRRRRARAAFQRSAHAQRLPRQAGSGRAAAPGGRPRQDGADQRQPVAAARRLPALAGGQGAARAGAVAGQSRQDAWPRRSSPSSATT